MSGSPARTPLRFGILRAAFLQEKDWARQSSKNCQQGNSVFFLVLFFFSSYRKHAKLILFQIKELSKCKKKQNKKTLYFTILEISYKQLKKVFFPYFFPAVFKLFLFFCTIRLTFFRNSCKNLKNELSTERVHLRKGLLYSLAHSAGQQSTVKTTHCVPMFSIC